MPRFDLGVGLALMPGLLDQLDGLDGLVDCLEVEPQTFWLETGDAAEPFRLAAGEIEALRGRFGALLAHGVSAPVGGSTQPDPAMVRLFRQTVRTLGAALASEHLSFNQADGADGPFGSAFFLPPRQTWSGVEVARESIDVLRHDLGAPFSVETPVSYLRPRPDELDDGAFVAAVAEQADCGILLDLHNIWANERNGRQAARSYVDQLPLERVWEVHLAGGLDRRGYWLDAHSGGLEPGLVALAQEVLPRLPEVRVVVYEILPEFVVQGGRNVLRSDLEAVHRLIDGVRKAQPVTRRPKPTRTIVSREAPPGAGPAEWEHVLATLAIGREPVGDRSLVDDLTADPGIDLLRELVGAGRAGRVASSLPLTIGLLVNVIGIDGVERLLADYGAATTPALWGSAEGLRFATWLAEQEARGRTEPVSLVRLGEAIRAVLRLDLAALESARTGRPERAELDLDPIALIGAIHRGDGPTGVPTGRYLVTVGGGTDLASDSRREEAATDRPDTPGGGPGSATSATTQEAPAWGSA